MFRISATAMGVRFRRILQYVLLVIVFIVAVRLLIYASRGPTKHAPDLFSEILHENSIDTTDGFYSLNREWFHDKCLGSYKPSEMSMEFLDEYINNFDKSTLKHCQAIGKIFKAMFELDVFVGEIRLSDVFRERVKKWLNNDPVLTESALKQKVIKVYNKFMHEEMIYNPIRGKRPSIHETSGRNFSLDLIEQSREKCDFCHNYQQNTADDVFDRIETPLSYTAANTFKYDRWHSLIVSRNHDTLFLKKAELIDMFKLTLKWFAKTNSLEASARYPGFIWDAMPKAGASQMHTHIQASMGINNYYGAMRRWIEAAASYSATHQRHFVDDFVQLHSALGLATKVNDVHVIFNLIPVKEQEVMLIGENDQVSYDTLIELIHNIIRIFVDKRDQYSFSMGFYLPEYEGSGEEFFPRSNSNKRQRNANKLQHIFCRLVFRTPVSNIRSDINGLDLYTSSVIGIDRYKLANIIFAELHAYRSNE